MPVMQIDCTRVICFGNLGFQEDYLPLLFKRVSDHRIFVPLPTLFFSSISLITGSKIHQSFPPVQLSQMFENEKHKLFEVLKDQIVYFHKNRGRCYFLYHPVCFYTPKCDCSSNYWYKMKTCCFRRICFLL